MSTSDPLDPDKTISREQVPGTFPTYVDETSRRAADFPRKNHPALRR